MKRFKKFIALILLAATLCFLLPSCKTDLGEPVMTLGDTVITENMLEFWLSRYKAYIVNYHLNGKDNKSFWDQKVSGSDKTWNETFTEFIIDNAKNYCAALYLFDELGLSVSDNVKKQIDDEIENLLINQADGNKNTFNEILSQYGVNMDILRELYLLEEKVEFVQTYLYGPNGVEPISTETKEQYYKDNYVRFKHVFLYLNNRPAFDADGNYKYNSDGTVAYREMSTEENDKVREKANNLLADIKAGNFTFEEVLEYHGEDIANDEYINGYYLSESSTYIEEVVKALDEMEVGEIRLVESKYGIHIIRRYELDAGAYSKAANKDFFSDFESSLIAKIFNARLEKYKNQIVIDEERLSAYCIKDANANYNY